MKTIGLIGGVTWASTVDYYRIINEEIALAHTDLHSAKIVLSSVDFGEVLQFTDREDWVGLTDLLVGEAKRLGSAGADFFLICANALHRVARDVEKQAPIPFLDLVNTVLSEIQKGKWEKVGLLGTRVTMESGFFKERLGEAGIETLIPDEASRKEVHGIIFDELVHQKIRESSRIRLQQIIWTLAEQGAKAVILGCTDFSQLIRPMDCQIPALDTTRIHALAAVRQALA